MLHPEGPSVSFDLSQARWVRRRYAERTNTVADFVPNNFEAYARILHPLSLPSGRDSVRWVEVAAAIGGQIHPAVQWESLLFHAQSPEALLARLGGPPPKGCLDSRHLSSLLRVLGAHTQSGEDCWFGLSSDWGWSHDLAVTMSIPEFTVSAGRAFILLRGSLNSALHLGQETIDGGFLPQSPNMAWPSDRAWFLCSDIDLDSTLIGGSQVLIDELTQLVEMEVLSVDLHTRIDADGDAVN